LQSNAEGTFYGTSCTTDLLITRTPDVGLLADRLAISLHVICPYASHSFRSKFWADSLRIFKGTFKTVSTIEVKFIVHCSIALIFVMHTVLSTFISWWQR